MKKILLFSVLFLILQSSYGQTSGNAVFIRNLKWWDTTGLLKSFDNDLDALSKFIDSTNNVLKRYKIQFDKKRSDSSTSLGNECDRDPLLITEYIDRIHAESFYIKGEKSTDSSFLYYYTNKELNDYVESLMAVKREMDYLCKGSSQSAFPNLNAFSSNNFLNAYYYASESRSLLLAAMDNLERHYTLGGVADNISRVADSIDLRSVTISETSGITKQNVDLANNTLHLVDSVGMHSDTLLTNSFKPYQTLKNKKQLDGSPTDKISTASNTILIDSRKNWWWRTLVGGVIGGLVAGLVVTAAQ
ncbi:MAG TPA: hypothetical protein VEV83_14540 [Parafilimonas sp.]|nr:hypothetical protein [Parafilimonas sp.]